MENNQNTLPEEAISEIRAMTILMLVVAIFSSLWTLLQLGSAIGSINSNPIQGILSLAQLGLAVFALVLLFQSWQAFQNYTHSKDGFMLHQAMKYTALYWKIQAIVLFVFIFYALIGIVLMVS